MQVLRTLIPMGLGLTLGCSDMLVSGPSTTDENPSAEDEHSSTSADGVDGSFDPSESTEPTETDDDIDPTPTEHWPHSSLGPSDALPACTSSSCGACSEATAPDRSRAGVADAGDLIGRWCRGDGHWLHFDDDGKMYLHEPTLTRRGYWALVDGAAVVVHQLTSHPGREFGGYYGVARVDDDLYFDGIVFVRAEPGGLGLDGRWTRIRIDQDDGGTAQWTEAELVITGDGYEMTRCGWSIVSDILNSHDDDESGRVEVEGDELRLVREHGGIDMIKGAGRQVAPDVLIFPGWQSNDGEILHEYSICPPER